MSEPRHLLEKILFHHPSLMRLVKFIWKNLPPTVEYSNVFLPDPNPSNSITRESIARESILNEISPARSSSTLPVIIQSVINDNTSNLQRLTLLNTGKKLNGVRIA